MDAVARSLFLRETRSNTRNVRREIYIFKNIRVNPGQIYASFLTRDIGQGGGSCFQNMMLVLRTLYSLRELHIHFSPVGLPLRRHNCQRESFSQNLPFREKDRNCYQKESVELPGIFPTLLPCTS